MGLAPHHHLVGKHDAFGGDERGGAVLFLERDRQAAGLQQAEDVAGGRIGQLALVGNDVVLGAITGGDVVLGDEGHQIGAAGDLMDLLGFTLGQKGADGIFPGGTGCRSVVHGSFPAHVGWK